MGCTSLCLQMETTPDVYDFEPNRFYHCVFLEMLLAYIHPFVPVRKTVIVTSHFKDRKMMNYNKLLRLFYSGGVCVESV